MIVLQMGHELLLAAMNAKDQKDVASDDVRIWVAHAAKMFHQAANGAACARCDS